MNNQFSLHSDIQRMKQLIAYDECMLGANVLQGLRMKFC